MSEQESAGWPAKTDLGIDGMLVTVVKLRQHGRRITRQEMDEATPLTGRITVELATGGSGVIAHSKVAELYSANQQRTTGSVTRPLFEPALMRWSKGGIVLAGFEINVIDGQAIQHYQAWLVRPLTDQPDI